MIHKKNLPELLSPAGSMQAFMAAIDGGADAIYLGGTSFNARINANNFTTEELSEAVKLAHTYGIKVYATLNTLLFDKEKEGFLSCAEDMANCGIDAFIVADLGAAALLRSHMPGMPLHASTQISAHNTRAGKKLAELGFTRLVPARELSARDIKTLVDKNPLEVEIFVHGALCVSHSGQCLFSSIVGGRSGNRGLCAQPCRLPYSCSGTQNNDTYPLSLKDLSLANHVTDILEIGVHSLKIEGRMKSPEYVRTVTKIWRTLLDEGRNATNKEMAELADIFSRGGFTDGYFTHTINRSMLGIRTQADKLASVTNNKFTKITRKLPLDIKISVKRGSPSLITLTCCGKTICAEGETAQESHSPIDKTRIERSISKLGDTPFYLQSAEIDLDPGLMLPVSSLNALRRSGISSLINVLSHKGAILFTGDEPSLPSGKKQSLKIGRFQFDYQITPAAKEYFDKIFLPLERYESIADGFIMPPVILDSEENAIEEMIRNAKDKGAVCAIVGNIGNISYLEDAELEIYGDYRFNVTNNYTTGAIERMGVRNITLSPELSIPQIRDISGDTSVIVYGRLPLMTLEKCAIRELYSCGDCDKYMSSLARGEYQNPLEMKDRRGFTFPIMREWQHRNVIYNSLPTCMSDRQGELEGAKITSQVFIFTVEPPAEIDRVIQAFKNKKALDRQIRRI